MKKIFSLLLILVLALGLTACSDDSGDDPRFTSLELPSNDSYTGTGGVYVADTKVNIDYILPATGVAIADNGDTEEVALQWDNEVDTSKVGIFRFAGSTSDVETDATINFTLTVNPENGTEITIENPIGDSPSVPANLAGTPTQGEDGVDLTWDNNGAGYIVYRGDKYTPLFEEPITTNSYTDYKVTPGETYTYFVRAVGDNGLNSDVSEGVEAVAGGYDGAKIHFKSTDGTTPLLYAWIDGGESVINGSWPGTEMESEGNGWYVTELPGDAYGNDVTFGIIFNKGSNKYRTKGEWWYKDSQWYYTNPEK